MNASEMIAQMITAVAVVGMWFLFTKFEKPGWHSLIPFLNEMDKCEFSGISRAVGILISSCILVSLSLISVFGLGFLSELGVPLTEHGINAPVTGTVSVVCTVLGIAVYFIAVGAMIRMYISFNNRHNISQWWLVAWILFPQAAYIYFGLTDWMPAILPAERK